VPWSWLTRIFVLAVARRFTRSRRTGQPAVDVEAVRSRAASARELAAIAARVATVAVLACSCAGLLVAGTPAVLLGPSWLGWTAFGAALLLALLAVPQIIRLRRALRARRLRLHDRDVGHELDSTRPV